MAPVSCGLDAEGLSAQLARYQAIGLGAHLVQRTPTRLTLEIADPVADSTIADLIAVENECCPFFEMGWEPDTRRLTIGVADPERSRDLELIATALADV